MNGTKEDTIAVKCSSCNSDMECPKGMAYIENHICHICTDTIASSAGKEDAKEIAEIELDVEKHREEMLKLGEFIHDTAFRANMPTKDEVKEASKKELAETMHFTGVMTSIDFFMHSAIDGRALKEILSIAESSKKLNPQNDKRLQAFTSDIQKFLDIIGAVGEKLENMGISEEECGRLIKFINHKDFNSLNENPDTEEGLTTIMNKLIFKGDWEKQLEWAEKHGTKEDVEVVRTSMKLSQ